MTHPKGGVIWTLRLQFKWLFFLSIILLGVVVYISKSTNYIKLHHRVNNIEYFLKAMGYKGEPKYE